MKTISQSRFTIPIESSEPHQPFANGAIPVDFENLKIDNEYQYSLNLYREMNFLFVGFYNGTIKRINNLIAAIDEEF